MKYIWLFSISHFSQAQFGFGYAASKLPSSAAVSVRDALNVDYLCANFSGVDFISPSVHASLERDGLRHAAARAAALSSVLSKAEQTIFYVATNGSDSNPGSIDRPFGTLVFASQAVRALGPRAPGSTVVYVRAGTYYMGESPLVLSELDSNVTWTAYPGDAPSPVSLSGALLLSNLNWKPWDGGVPGILVAEVNVTAPSRVYNSGAVGRAGPPPLVSSLFIDGVRR